MIEPLPDLSPGLPVFPLTGVTLFPRQHLSLHIFEERYRNLMADTLRKPDSQHCFAMGAIIDEPGDDALGDPPVYRYAGVGRVLEYSRTSDGRYMIVLQGIGRARLLDERPLVNGYRVFDAEWLSEVAPAPNHPLELELCTELRAIALAILREQSEKIRGLFTEPTRLGELTDLMCGYLPLRHEFKLEQLANPNALQRAARCITEIESVMNMHRTRPLKPDAPPDLN